MPIIKRGNRAARRRWLLALLVPMLLPAAAETRRESDRLLEEDAYRSELEEVVVVGQPPEWRKPPEQDQQWRPRDFELPEQTDKARIQWFPEYSKDERDQYDGVRDRLNEEPEIKIFEWKF